MAFLIERTLQCEFPGCDREFTLKCRSKAELEWQAQSAGWFAGSKIDGRHVHKCPEHEWDGMREDR